MTGLAAPSTQRTLRMPSRALLLAAACVVVLLVAGTALTRTALNHDEGVPAFQPQPLPGPSPSRRGWNLRSATGSPPSGASPDDAGLTVVKFDGIPAGGLVCDAGPLLTRMATSRTSTPAIAADNRLKVLHQVQTTVGGEPAIRLVVTPVPGTTASDWFCPDSDNPCFELDPTGRTTLYLFDHQGARYLLRRRRQ